MVENVIFSIKNKISRPFSNNPPPSISTLNIPKPHDVSIGALTKSFISSKFKKKSFIEVSNTFPFVLLPDKIQVDENKVTITHKSFFFSENIHSIMIRSVKDVAVETDLFFATIRIVPDGFPATQETVVKFLKKKEAMQLRDLIQGLMEVHQRAGDPKEFLEEHLKKFPKT